MKKITAFLFEDRAPFRDGLRLLLEATTDIEVIGEAMASKNLLRAIREACRGNACLGPPITERLLEKHRNGDSKSETTASPALTRRQTEVVQLIADGYSSRQIAGVLSVSRKTVEKHRQAVMNKLDIHEVASLTRYAVSNGIVESNHLPSGTVMSMGVPADQGVRLQDQP